MSETLAPPAPAVELRALATAYNRSARPGRRAHSPHLRAVYARGVAVAPSTACANGYGMARVHAFLSLLASCSTPVNPLTPDRDLLPPHHPLSLRAVAATPPAPDTEFRPLTAAIIIDSLGRPWKSFLHPRDKNGQFIPTLGNLQLFDRGSSGVSNDHYATGRYIGANPDGSVQVRLNAINDPNKQDQIGEIISVPADQVATVSSGDRRQKASIAGTPTSADEDSIEYRNTATQDAFDEGVARLGDTATPNVNVNGKPYSEGDRITTQVHSEDGGQDEISSRDGTIKKISTDKHGTPNALIEFDGEQDDENPDAKPELAILDLNSPDIARAGDPTNDLIRGTQARLDRARNAPPPAGPQVGELPFTSPRPANPTPIDELFPPGTAPAPEPTAPEAPQAPDAEVPEAPAAPEPEAPEAPPVEAPEIIARIPERVPAAENPQAPPAPDIQDINRESTTVGENRPAAPRLSGHEAVGERLTPPNSRGEQFGIGAVIRVQPPKRGKTSGDVGRIGVVGNINPSTGRARLYFKNPETGEYEQTNKFFAVESLAGVDPGDVDYLAFLRDSEDARGRGLLPGFKRIAPLQPKGSTTATDERIAEGADSLPIRKGDHVAGVRGKDGTVVQGIVQNINPKGDVVQVIPYGGGDKIAISPKNLRWVRNASSSYNAGDREDIFVDKNMDHGAAAPDRESLKDVLVAAGFSDDTINAVDDTDPADLGDLLSSDPAFDDLARRQASAAALAPDDPERHSSQNRADRMYGSVVRAGVAGRISGETVPRKPPEDQITRESARDEFESYFPSYFNPEGGTPAPPPEPETGEDGTDLPEPPTPEVTPDVPEPDEEELPAPPAPPEPTPEAPAPAPQPVPSMSPAERASKAYSALATNLQRHPDKRVQAMGKDIQAVANELDRAVKADANGDRAGALENLERVGGLAKLIRTKNRAVLRDLIGPGSTPAERNLVTNGIFRMIADAERISGGRDRALAKDDNQRMFNPGSPIARMEETPEAPDVRTPAAAPTPGGAGGSLTEQALGFPDPDSASAAEMDQAFTDLIAAVNADAELSPVNKSKASGALTRARRAVEKSYDPDRSDDQREALLNAAADRLDTVARDIGGDKGDALAVVGGKLESMSGGLPAGLPSPPTTPRAPAPTGRAIPAPRRPTPDAAPPTPEPTPAPEPESATPAAPEAPEAPAEPAAPAGPAATPDWDLTPPSTPVEPGASTPPRVPPPSADPTQDVWDALQREFDVAGFNTPQAAQEQARRNAAPAVEGLFQSNGSDLGRTRDALTKMYRDNGSEQPALDATALINTWAGQRGIAEMETAGLPLHSNQTIRESIGRVYAGLTDSSVDVSVVLSDVRRGPTKGESAIGMAQLMEHRLPPSKSRDDTAAYYRQYAELVATGGDTSSLPKPKVEAPNDPNFKRRDLGNGLGLGYVGADNASVMVKNGNSYWLAVLATPEDALRGKTITGLSLLGWNGQSYTPVGYHKGPATAGPAYTDYIAKSGELTSPIKERALNGPGDANLRDDRDFAPGTANWNQIDAAEYDQARRELAYRRLSEQLSVPGRPALSVATIREHLFGQNLDPDKIALPTARVYRNGNINLELGQDTLDLWGDKTDAHVTAYMAHIDKLMGINGVHDKPVSIRVSDDVFKLSEKVERKGNSSTLAWAILADHSISVKASYPYGATRGGDALMDQTNTPGSTQWSAATGGKTTGLTTLSHEWGHMTDITDGQLQAYTIGSQNAIDNGVSPFDHRTESVDKTTVLLDSGEVEWYDYKAINAFAKRNDPTLSRYSGASQHELRAEQFAEWVESDGQTESSTTRFFYGSDQDRKNTVSIWFENSRTAIASPARQRYQELVSQGMDPKDASWQAFREFYGSYNRSVQNHGAVYSSLVGIAGDQSFTNRLWGMQNQLNQAGGAAA